MNDNGVCKAAPGFARVSFNLCGGNLVYLDSHEIQNPSAHWKAPYKQSSEGPWKVAIIVGSQATFIPFHWGARSWGVWGGCVSGWSQENRQNTWKFSCKACGITKYNFFPNSPFLVECLYVGQQEVSVGELFLTLRALARLYLVTVLWAPMLLILPFYFKHFMALLTREGPEVISYGGKRVQM